MTRKEILLLIVLAALQFCHIIDFMIVMPLGEKFMTDFRIGPGEFSWLISVYAGAAFVASLASAGFVDRFDRRSALLIAHVGFTVGTLACGFMDSFYALLICRGITGAFGGLIATQVLAIVGDYFPIERRGRAMGVVMTAFSVASVVGVPIGINLAAWKGWAATFLGVGVLAVIFGILAFFQVPSLRGHIESKNNRPSAREMFAGVARNGNQRLALVFTVILMLGHFTVVPFIATYMQVNLGLGDSELSILYMLGGALTVVSLPLVGKAVDRFGAPQIFTIGSIATIAVILTVTNLPAGLALGLILTASSSLFISSGARTVPALTLVTSVVKPENRGGFMSLRASVNQAGMGCASFIAGLIISEGPNGELLHFDMVGILAAIMGVLAVFLAWRLKAIA